MLQEKCTYFRAPEYSTKNRISVFQLFIIALLSLSLISANKTGQFPKVLSFQQVNRNATDALIILPQLTELDPAIYLPLINFGASIYYISPSGDDSNPGTLAKPWRSIQKAANNASPGEIIYLRGGTYNEYIEVYKSGSQKQPIQFKAYPGETPIIDGNNQLPPYPQALFSVFGDWVNISGIEIRNSSNDGLGLYGSNDRADKIFSHHNRYMGIMITGDYCIVENSRAWRNSLVNEYGVLQSNWSTGISSANRNTIAEHNIIRNNIVWENWGEGISVHESTLSVVENNIAHDNYSTNFYISDASNILFQGNFAYMDPNSYVYGYGYGHNVGIMMGDEKYNPPSENITMVNNIAFGNNVNFWWWQGVQGGGMKNVLIANNTFVNSKNTSGIIIHTGTHQNVRFMNNVIQQDGDLLIIDLDDATGITFSNNLWSKAPTNEAFGYGDIIGDPALAHSGEPYTPEWFGLTNSSPAIDVAISLPETVVDFLEAKREPPPDMGAIEFFKLP